MTRTPKLHGRRTCLGCKKRFPHGEVVDGYCSDCDEEKCWCLVCNDEQTTDGHCRHVYKSCGWVGSGVRRCDEEQRDGLWRLLDVFAALPDECWRPRWREPGAGGLVDTLRDAVAAHRFSTFLASWITRGRYELIRWADGTGPGRAIVFAELAFPGPVADIVESLGDDQDLTDDGWAWLQTLEPGRTDWADELTAQWIDRWLQEHQAGRRPATPHIGKAPVPA